MKRFTEYLSEEVLPTAMVQDGSFDIENDAVRAEVNAILAGICSRSHVTPYITLRKISKALAYFSIILPKRTFLEGSKGVEVYEIMQFGDRMGMTDDGEFVKSVPEKYYLFFQFNQLLGMFSCTAKVVNKDELDKMLDMAEVMMKESCACDDKATQSQRSAGREDIITYDKDGTISSKKAKKDSDANNKKLEEEQIDELKKSTLASYIKKAAKNQSDHSFDHGEDEHRQYGDRGEDPDRDREVDDRERKISNREKGIGRAVNKLAKEETQIDEMNQRKETRYKNIIKVSKNSKGETRKEKESSISNKLGGDVHKGEIRRALKKQKYGKKNILQDKKDKERKAELDHLKMFDIKAYWKKKDIKEEYEKVEAGVKKRPGETHTLHRRNPGHKTEYHTITTERDGRKSVKTGSPKYIKKHWDKLEEESFGVFRKGGSIGEKPSTDPIKSFDSAEEAKAHAKGMNSQLSPGEKKYYRIKYHVKPIKKEKTLDEASDKDRALSKLASDAVSKGHPVKKLPAGRAPGSTLPKSMAKGPNIERGRWSGHGKFGLGEDTMEEGMTSVKKSYGMRKMKKKVSTQVKQGLGIEKGRDKTILVTNKGDPHAAGGGGVHRISKDKYDPSKHNLASE